MSTLVAVPTLTTAEEDVLTGVPDEYRHFFNGRVPVPFTKRHWEFAGRPVSVPLVRAFLQTCAAGRDFDYRYVLTLLGTELATNAIRHSRSGEPDQTFVVRVDRGPNGMTVTCRDNGMPTSAVEGRGGLLFAASPEDRLAAEDGRGLALIDSFATAWGDNGHPSIRKVWFHLAYDLTGSSWPAA